MIHLTQVAAAQLGRSKIRVNAICPGFIQTDIFASGMRAMGMNDQMVKAVTSGMFEQQSNAQPIPKAGLPADIAKACLYFASDDSEFVTGTYLQVDGGMTTGPRQAWDPEEQARRMQMRAALASKS